MEKAFIVKNLTFKYGQRIVLDKISFNIEKGDMVTVIGPNGSGKSTLLKILASILTCKRGELFLENKELQDYSVKELARKISIVPQTINIEYAFTVYEIVLMGRNPYIRRFGRETAKDISLVEEAMKKTNVWHLRDRNVQELSGGEGQRVVIARALAQEPEILLLDEPTSTLDIDHQIEILDLLRGLNKEKAITIVMALHDINLAIRYSDEIILLNKGTKLAMGRPEEIITEGNLQDIYRTNIVIARSKYTDCLEITALSGLR